MFPPGWLSRGTMPLATGSAAFPKTIGIVCVSRWRAIVGTVPLVKTMSGCRPTNSCASARVRLTSARPHRTSIRTLLPSVQPKPGSACVNAETRRFSSESFSSFAMSTPMRRIRLPCCALAVSGQAAAPPRSVTNSRRLMPTMGFPPGGTPSVLQYSIKRIAYDGVANSPLHCGISVAARFTSAPGHEQIGSG
jgi:hypothetical protein